MAKILMYLWIQGIDGLSQDPRHLREINVESFSFGSKDASAVGYGSWQESAVNFEFIKLFDGVSPILHQAAASGKHFAKAILTVERNFGGRSAGELIRVVMSDVIIANTIRVSTSKVPVADDFESIGLNYASISWKHKE